MPAMTISYMAENPSGKITVCRVCVVFVQLKTIYAVENTPFYIYQFPLGSVPIKLPICPRATMRCDESLK